MSTGWRRDGKPAALGKSRTDVTRESLPIFVFFFFKKLFVRATLKLRNRSKILEGLLSWLFFKSMDCSLPGSSVHLILQARILEWVQFSSIQSLSHVWLFATPWTAAHQASLSIISSWSLLKLMSIELVMPSNHLTLCCPLLSQSFPASGSFQMSQFFASGGQNIGVSASASVLPMNIQYWFPLGWTGWSSLPSKGFSKVFSNITVQRYQFCGAQPFLLSSYLIHAWLLEKP